MKLVIEYDGSDFHGWAAQPGLRTVEAEVRRALETIYRHVEALAVAGRTDAGVHALGQVVSVDVAAGAPPARAAAALNAVLPADIAVREAAEAPPNFHARFSARARSYRYRIFRRRERSPFEARRSWWYPYPLDEERLAAAAEALIGERDFRAFTPTQTQHAVFVRVVEAAAWHRRGDALEFEITADSFLRHMVRTLVGTMIERSPEDLALLLEGAERAAAGTTAPPQGLYLLGARY